MANHVNTHVRFEKLSDAGVAKLQELYSRVGTDDGYEWFSDIFGVDHETSRLYEWNLEHVGPKWCYFEDRGEDHFTTVSAWSFPQAGLEWVFEQIATADPDFIASVFYEDEMPNFFGVYVYNKDGMVDGCEWGEDGEIKEMMEEMVPELKNLNEETQEQEYYDLWSDNIWDLVHDKQGQTNKDILDYLKSSKE